MVEVIVVEALRDKDAVSNAKVAGQCNSRWRKVGEESACGTRD